MGLSIKLSDLNDFITCTLCNGYLIDATTVNECLHTFCRSCIVKYIKNDHNECPKCNTIIHERRPLDYITHDRNKQDIVYKLVPQLYISELTNRLDSDTSVVEGQIDPVSRTVLDKQFLHVILVQRTKSTINNVEQYMLNSLYKEQVVCDSEQHTSDGGSTISPTHKNEPSPEKKPPNSIYLKCPLTVKVCQLRKLLVYKYQLSASDKVTLLYKGDIVNDDDQISNLAQSLTFCLHYEVSRISSETID